MTDKKLITLEEHNEAATRRYFNRECEPLLNGIACPVCGGEMEDDQPGMVLTSYPPKKSISCRNCGHRTTRVA
jgi:hypothetical protein